MAPVDPRGISSPYPLLFERFLPVGGVHGEYALYALHLLTYVVSPQCQIAFERFPAPSWHKSARVLLGGHLTRSPGCVRRQKRIFRGSPRAGEASRRGRGRG